MVGVTLFRCLKVVFTNIEIDVSERFSSHQRHIRKMFVG